MCGIAGAIHLKGQKIPDLEHSLDLLSRLIQHRGPDGQGRWSNPDHSAGLAHRRLSVIDLRAAADQPMLGPNGTILTYNGEVYNYRELQSSLTSHWRFSSISDTETILAAYSRWGLDAPKHLRGMFSFALWDQNSRQLLCARDRFGIKPFYYTIFDDVFYFASEAKALLPFLHDIETDQSALAEYLTFQYTIGDKTLFKGIRQLLPGHCLVLRDGNINLTHYWDVDYQVDFNRSEDSFHEELRVLVNQTINLHLRSDVPIGSYLSGGIDSSLVYCLANGCQPGIQAFHGRFLDFPGYDESDFAQAAALQHHGALEIVDITARDFSDQFSRLIYHLDYPVAGPGSFPQFMTSRLASQHVKVVLGGQGGDEIFGGYARYVIAYFEQCIKAAIDGTYQTGNYVVTLESIIPNLGLLREYKPLIIKFWSEGLFEPMDQRYFRLINRANDMKDEIAWERFDQSRVFEDFCAIFNNRNNVRKEAYFDKMTHFDIKCQIPALLHVEDRMSMAHGLESRVPLLDHPLVEFAATIPANFKFKDGRMKHLLKEVFQEQLPDPILRRRDKMGFPVPLKEWFEHQLKDFAFDILQSMASKDRPFIQPAALLKNRHQETRFSRKTWGLLSLEIWHQLFHDQAAVWRRLRTESTEKSLPIP
ncbi:MAG: asparagine synthase (glutamine-hydrolyzing) [Puniceicoccaceae bacterium]